MLQRSNFLLPLLIATLIGCGEMKEGDIWISNLIQALYNGPTLKSPLPAGYNWKVNAEAEFGKSGDCYPDPKCIDHFHVNRMAIDFGRHVQDNLGGAKSFDDGQVDIYAAADGIVTTSFRKTGCSNEGLVCMVNIDHGNGYKTQYLHFTNDTIVVSPGQQVVRGQYLGKMGSTGKSTGTHLHFEVFYNNSSATSSPGLSGLKLDGKDFLTDYQYGKYLPSTNGFTFDYANGANLHTCSNEQNGGNPANGWTFSCNRSTSFASGQTVWTNLRLTNLQKDFCVKMEYDLGNSKIFETGEWCSSTIESDGGWSQSYFWSGFVPTQPGNTWKTLYYVRLKNGSYMPKPMAVTPNYTVASAPVPTIPPAPSPLSPVSNPPYPATKQVSTSLRPVTLNWTSVPGATKYQLYFFILNGGIWTQYGPWEISGTSASISVRPTATCAWRVAACNNVGCSANSYAGNFIAVP